jgi:hypothetical protein
VYRTSAKPKRVCSVFDIGPYLVGTPGGRLVVVLSAPLWIPAAVALVFIAAMLLWLSTLTWCPLVRVISWVRYGDQYALGNYWWVLDDTEASSHRYKTEQARSRLGL